MTFLFVDPADFLTDNRIGEVAVLKLQPSFKAHVNRAIEMSGQATAARSL